MNRSVSDFGGGTDAHTFPQHIWERLLEGAAVIHAAPGDSIYRAGQAPQPAAILSGIVRVFTLTPAGRQVTVRHAGPGALIGVVPGLGGSDAWEARAKTAVSAALLPLEHIEAVGRRQPEIMWAIARDMAGWAAAAISHIADEAAAPTTVRVARQLLDLAVSGPEGEVVVHVSHQGLADAVGTAREVVTRTLRSFRIQGLVDTRQGGVVITDPAGLARVAGGGTPHRLSER